MENDNYLRWFDVNRCISGARYKLVSAVTIEDYQSIGLLCREGIISLGQYILDVNLHGYLPGISRTDSFEILSKLINNELSGKSNEQMRAYAKACLDLTNGLQHSRTATLAQARFCVEATLSLYNLIRVLAFKDGSHPDKKLVSPSFTSAEVIFLVDCLWEDFNRHPVALTEGFIITGTAQKNEFITLHASFKGQTLTATINRLNWWKNANREMASKLLDEFLILLVTEKETMQNN